MVPAEGGQGVPPADARLVVVGVVFRIGGVIDVEDVAAVVDVEEELVALAQPVGDLRRSVVEIIIRGAAQRGDQPVEEEGVHSADAHAVGGRALPDGALEVELVADDAHADRTVRLLHVAVVRAHIDDAGRPAAVPGGEGSLEEGHLLDGFRLEDRKQAQHVFCVVQGDAVEQQEVFVRPAAADIDAREAFVAALDARHQLDGFQDVRFAQEHRCVPDGGHRNLHGAHLRRRDARFAPGGDDGFLDAQVGLQGDVQRRVPDQVDFQVEVGIAYIRIVQRGFPGGECQGVEAVGIRDGPDGARTDARSDQGLPGSGIRDVTADGAPGRPALRERGDAAQEKERNHQDGTFEIFHNSSS